MFVFLYAHIRRANFPCPWVVITLHLGAYVKTVMKHLMGIKSCHKNSDSYPQWVISSKECIFFPEDPYEREKCDRFLIQRRYLGMYNSKFIWLSYNFNGNPDSVVLAQQEYMLIGEQCLTVTWRVSSNLWHVASSSQASPWKSCDLNSSCFGKSDEL